MGAEGGVVQQLNIIKATTERIEVGTDPQVDLFQVTLERKTDGGVWMYAAVSLIEHAVFLNGVRAGAELAGWRLEEDEVPHEPTRHFGET